MLGNAAYNKARVYFREGHEVCDSAHWPEDETTTPMKPLAFAPIALCFSATAQNLVPNGSFEEYVECPSSFGQWYQVVGWGSPYFHSADYYNSCSPNVVSGVPFNTSGYQYADDGQAYVGIYTYEAPYYREMMSTELSEPLQIGVPVCLSFSMAIGCFGSWDGNSMRYSSNNVGLRFFHADQLPGSWPEYELVFPNAAALYQAAVPIDTSIWYSVSGLYIPDSAYTHVVIANFFENALTNLMLVDTQGFGLVDGAYAFIDDVRVSFDLDYCNTNTAIDETVRTPLTVYPNPFAHNLEIILPRPPVGPVEIRIVDSIGQVAWSARFVHGARVLSLPIKDLSIGAYVVIVSDERGPFPQTRVVHVSP